MQNNSLFLRAEEVAQIMNVSVPKAYVLIKQMNNELKAKNYLVVAGKVNRAYFESKIYGGFSNGVQG